MYMGLEILGGMYIVSDYNRSADELIISSCSGTCDARPSFIESGEHKAERASKTQCISLCYVVISEYLLLRPQKNTIAKAGALFDQVVMDSMISYRNMSCV